MKGIFLYCSITLVSLTNAQSPAQQWDNIKQATTLEISPLLASEYETPYPQPLASYGWEDGLQISTDGLNLYALYTPMDLLSYTNFFVLHSSLPLCSLLGNPSYLREYAPTYGMDLISNPFGCDQFANIDILYAHRSTITSAFTTWQLSDIARPGTQEGGPAPLLKENDRNELSLFMFTEQGAIWQIQNTSVNPAGIGTATKLGTHINPITNEFNADNPFIERLGTNSVILIYEKFVDPSLRTFMYSISGDTGNTWANPKSITTINNSLGHIEHPCLFKDPSGQWWLYFSIDYTHIARSKQLVTDNWDSWDTPEIIISKGNAASIGEPSLTRDGSISFSVGYHNTMTSDTTDVYELDPWYLPKVSSPITEIPASLSKENNFIISPNPAAELLNISIPESNTLQQFHLYNSIGCLFRVIETMQSIQINIAELPKGLYFLCLKNNPHQLKKFIKL